MMNPTSTLLAGRHRIGAARMSRASGGPPPHPPFGHVRPAGEQGMVSLSERNNRAGGSKRWRSPHRGGDRGEGGLAVAISEAPPDFPLSATGEVVLYPGPRADSTERYPGFGRRPGRARRGWSNGRSVVSSIGPAPRPRRLPAADDRSGLPGRRLRPARVRARPPRPDEAGAGRGARPCRHGAPADGGHPAEPDSLHGPTCPVPRAIGIPGTSIDAYKRMETFCSNAPRTILAGTKRASV
jgi:hypothetical protein